MAWLRNVGIGARLSLAFFLVVLLLAATAVYGVISLQGMKASMHVAVEQRMLRAMDLAGVKEAAQTVGILVRDAALTEDPALVESNGARIDKVRKEIDGTLQELGRRMAENGSPAGRQLFAKLGEARNAYNGQLDIVMRQLRGGEFAGARAGLVATLPAAQAPYFNTLDEMMALGRKLALEAVQDADEQYVFSRNVLIAIAAVVAVLAVALGAGITRSITRPARHALEAAEALAQGRLAHAIKVRSHDEMGRMLGALERAFGQLTVLVRGIRDASGEIGTATREIASGNANLSQRTEEQAASLEQTAASMEQLTSTVRQNAENARQANQLAVNASDVATEGGRVVRGVVQTMDHISQSSAKVAEIVGVIEGIAFQTNILALNAAVEAARAGEQGRGFSVVAAEVRSLAQRSSSAAKEIGELIGGSVQQVKDGARQVEEAGRTMDEIVGAVRRVTDIMGEISAASEEQSAGIEQVSLAISQMEGVTQQNAALVEQAAAAAESLLHQANGLVGEVAKFDLGAEGGGRVVERAGMEPPRPAVTQAVARPVARPAAPAPVRAAAPRAAEKKIAKKAPAGEPARVTAAMPAKAPAPVHAGRAPAVPAAARPPIVRKPNTSVLSSTREPARPAAPRAPVTRQRREPVLASASRARPAALAAAGDGDWETF